MCQLWNGKIYTIAHHKAFNLFTQLQTDFPCNIAGLQGKWVSQVWQALDLACFTEDGKFPSIDCGKEIKTQYIKLCLKHKKKLNTIYEISACLYTLEHHQASVKKAYSVSVLGFSHLHQKLASSKPSLPSTYKRTWKHFSPLIIPVIKCKIMK